LTPKTYHLNWTSLYWLAWILAFLGPELYWLASNARYTLSETVWSIEGLNKAQPFDFPIWTATHWTVALTVWLLFLWLSLHLPFGLLR
jgi:hypothetical protein